jgi:hypothetical protein
MAGEFVVALKSDGAAYVQFTKTPFPFLEAQSISNLWAVELPSLNKRYGGRGLPPKRLMWLYLPRALRGESLPRNWTWHMDDSGWRLENTNNKEQLEGYFSR